MSREKISVMLKEIYGYVDDHLIEEFNNCFKIEPLTVTKAVFSFDQEINEMLQNNPFSAMTEGILNDFPIYIDSPLLDVKCVMKYLN